MLGVCGLIWESKYYMKNPLCLQYSCLNVCFNHSTRDVLPQMDSAYDQAGFSED